jgi:hypothetical protein
MLERSTKGKELVKSIATLPTSEKKEEAESEK